MIERSHDFLLFVAAPQAEQTAEAGDLAKETQGDIGEQAEAADQIELLSDQAHLGADRANVAAKTPIALYGAAQDVNLSLATVDRVQAGDGTQKRRFTGSGRADQRDALRPRHGEGHAVQCLVNRRSARGFRLTGKGLADRFDLDEGSRHSQPFAVRGKHKHTETIRPQRTEPYTRKDSY